MELSPLSNFRYSIWRPKWLPPVEIIVKILLLKVFSAIDQHYIWLIRMYFGPTMHLTIGKRSRKYIVAMKN